MTGRVEQDSVSIRCRLGIGDRRVQADGRGALGGVAPTQRDYRSSMRDGANWLSQEHRMKGRPLATVPVVRVQMADIRP